MSIILGSRAIQALDSWAREKSIKRVILADNCCEDLIDWAFNQTSQKKLIEKNQFVKEVDVWLGSEPKINLISSNNIISTLSYDQIQLMKSKIEYTKPIPAPIIKGNEYGKLYIEIEGKPTIEVLLIAEKDISKVNPFLKIIAAAKYLLFGTSLDEN